MSLPEQWPEGIVDPHIHQWDPFTTPRAVSREARLLKPLPRVPRPMRRLLPQADREFALDPTFLVKRYLPRHYAADAQQVPVSSVVHIEAAWGDDRPLGPAGETRWIESLPWGEDGAPELAAQVVHADPRSPQAPALLDAHAEASDRVRGVRCSAAHSPDAGVRDFTDSAHLLVQAAFLRGFAAVAERGLSFEVWAYSHELADARLLAREYPETTFVLDHYGSPVGAFGPRGRATGRTQHERERLLDQWHEDVSSLAELPNVVAKHSGLGMPVLGGTPDRQVDACTLDEVVDRCAPLVRHVHESFGPERTMWASNYPIDKPVQSLPASIAVLCEVLGDDLDLDLALRDVARRVYRLA